MQNRKNNDLESVKLFITDLMNEEQNTYSKLVADLKKYIGSTKEYDEANKVMSQVYDAKKKLLEKIYQELQRY